jgi:tetratricopeptide (TPR) repeat protein
MLPGISPAQTAATKTETVRAHLQKGQAAMNARNLPAAAQEFRAVLALDPGNVEANVKLGVIAFSQADYRAAAQRLRKALSVQPAIPQTQALLAICERKLGNSSAQALLEGSFAKVSDVRLRTQVGMELVGLYYQRGDPERALPVVQKLVEINPDDVDILYTAQRLYRELAEETLNKLAVMAPGSARMQQVIAERLVNDNDLKGAIEHYRKALEIDPRLPGARYELAQAVLSASPSDSAAQAEAEKQLTTAIAAEGDSAPLQCTLGRVASLRSDLDAAKVHYSRALALDPGNSEAQLGMGKVLMSLGNPQGARKYLEQAVKSDPLNSTAHYRLALAYRRLQMAEAAQKEMKLFDEIKKTMEQVRALYRQMNSQPQGLSDEPTENHE